MSSDVTGVVRRSVDHPHIHPPDALLSILDSGIDGLTTGEASRRLVEYGPNELKTRHRISPWSVLLDQFKNVLVIILVIATILSAFLGHGIEAVAITVIVLFAVVLGFVQEYRAERALEALRDMTAPTAVVFRGGHPVEIPTREVVPGDILSIRAGNRIAADARLFEVMSLQTQEAALTGESLPVEKNPSTLTDPGLAPGDRRNMVFAGTAATYGRGRAVVTATGMETEFGRIAGILQSVETSRTPLQANLDRLGRALARASFALVAVVVALGLIRGQPFIEMLVFGVALAVAVVPEALPAVVTISLALGVQRLVKRRALMRRLPAVETLGSTSVICSDKTGTLTRDEMTVRRIHTAWRMIEVSGAGYVPEGLFTSGGAPVESFEPLDRLLMAASLASDATVAQDEADGSWRLDGDPTEGALVVAAMKAGFGKPGLDALYPRIHEIPFSSEARRMTTLHSVPEGIEAFSKGAPEVILDACTSVMTEAGSVELDATGRAAILDSAQAMASSALRVLGIATRSGATPSNAQTDMVFLGLMGMIDPPRPEAREAIETCRTAGIRAVMITGDHPATARAVADELGMLEGGRVLTGSELESMTDAEFGNEVENIRVYARVSPLHKLRVVTALQRKGCVVAMTGDGVNDAPALKKADIGVAMGISGTDVAREAAAMTLTDDNFASIVAAVEEGRGIFGNIKKYLMYLLSSNIGEIGLMAGASFLGLPLPLTAVQILYVNLATDGLPALALAVDPPEPDLMRQKPRDPRTSIFTRPVVWLMLVAGIWSTLVNLGVFAWARGSGRSDLEAGTMSFLTLVLIQFVNAFNFRSDHASAFRRPFANRWLNAAVLWELTLLMLVVNLHVMRAPFSTTALSSADWVVVTAAAISILPVVEAAKWVRRRMGGMG
jgi:P-type Ca2+ transporter type 2C